MALLKGFGSLRPASRGLSKQSAAAKRRVATIANFKVPAIANEPNVSETVFGALCVSYADGELQQHYPKGSVERQKLQGAVAALKQRIPLEVPIAVGGQQVCDRCIALRAGILG